MEYPNRKKGLWCAFFVFTIWGFTLLASSVAQMTTDPVVFIMYRFLLSSLLMLIPVLTGRKKMRLDRKKLLCIFILGLSEPVLYFPCEQFGLLYTNSSFLGILLAMIPVVTMFFGAVLLHERPTGKQWIFSTVSIIGVVALTLITGRAEEAITPWGVVLCVLAVLLGSAYGIIIKKISPCTTPYERTFGTCVMGAVFFTVWALFRYEFDLAGLLEPLGVLSFDMSVLYVSVLGSVVGYSLLNIAYDNAPTANVVVFCNLQTVLAVLCGVLFLGDPFSLEATVAMLVVMVGIWGVQHFERRA